MKSGYKEMEFVRNDFKWGSEFLNGSRPMKVKQSVLSDLEELDLTTQVLRCKDLVDLFETLKNARHVVLNNQVESYRKVWQPIKSAVRISRTTLFHESFLIQLNKIPQEYGLRAKTAEIVFQLP